MNIFSIIRYAFSISLLLLSLVCQLNAQFDPATVRPDSCDCNYYEQEIRELKTDKQLYAEKLEKLEKYKGSYQLAADSVRLLRRNIAQQKIACDRLAGVEQRREELSDELSQCKREKERLERKINALTKDDLKKKLAECKEESRKKDDTIERLKQEGINDKEKIATQKDRIEYLKEKADDQEKDNDELYREKSTLIDEKQQLLADINALKEKHRKETAAHQAEVNKLEAELAKEKELIAEIGETKLLVINNTKSNIDKLYKLPEFDGQEAALMQEIDAQIDLIKLLDDDAQVVKLIKRYQNFTKAFAKINAAIAILDINYKRDSVQYHLQQLNQIKESPGLIKKKNDVRNILNKYCFFNAELFKLFEIMHEFDQDENGKNIRGDILANGLKRRPEIQNNYPFLAKVVQEKQNNITDNKMPLGLRSVTCQ